MGIPIAKRILAHLARYCQEQMDRNQRPFISLVFNDLKLDILFNAKLVSVHFSMFSSLSLGVYTHTPIWSI